MIELTTAAVANVPTPSRRRPFASASTCRGPNVPGNEMRAPAIAQERREQTITVLLLGSGTSEGRAAARGRAGVVERRAIRARLADATVFAGRRRLRAVSASGGV